MDPEKLKVVDLRKELQQRGLETKGNKAVLVKRLRDALDQESGKAPTKSTKPVEQDSLDAENDEDHEEEAEPEEEPVKIEPKTPKKAAPVKKEVPATPKTVVKEQAKPVEKSVKAEPKQATPVKAEPAEAPEANGEKVKETPKAVEVKMETETRGEKRKRDDDDESEEVESKEKKRREDSPVKAATKSPTKTPSKSSTKSPTKTPSKTPIKKEKVVPKEDEPEIDNTKSQLSWFDSDLHLKIDNKTFLSAKPLNEGCFGYIWAGARANHGVSSGKVCFEVKITEELKWDDPAEKMQEKTDKVLKDRYKIDRRKEKVPKSDDKKSESSKDDKKDKKKSETDKDGEKKTDEKSSEGENEKNKKSEENGEKPEEKMETEEAKSEEKEKVEGEEEKEKVEGEEGKEAEPKEEAKPEEKKAEEETKPEEKKDEKEAVKKMETEEDKEKPEEKPQLPPIPTHYFRVGFSLPKSTLQLGESKHSYAYESTGKFITDKEFKDYGVTFGVGDVVGAYLSIDDDNASITFTVNGALQPTAITVPRSDFPEENFSLFPHVLCRNYAYELNFGQKEEPWFPHPEELKDYLFLQAVEGKIEGPKRHEKREDCEVLLMVGLPGSGKSQWVKNHITSQTDKHYTVIGNHPLFDRMTVDGEPMKSRFRGSWKILVDRMQKCLNQLTDLAALRRRNFVIDQTNVFPNAQRRKLRAFDGFKRKAVIVICEDDEHARRQKDQQNDYGKSVPESTMYDLKAQMELPQKCEWLDELIFTDLNEEEAKKKVKAYNEEATKKGYFKRYQLNAKRNQQRNFRGNRRGGAPYNAGRFDRSSQGSGYNRPSSWGNRRDSRPPPSRQGGGSAWKQSNRGSVRSYDQSRSRDNRSAGGYGGSRNQGGGRNTNPWGNSGSGSNWGSGNSHGGGWNAAIYGSHGYGAWNQQNQGQSAWKFGNNQGGYSTGQGQRGYGGNQGGYGSNQGYGGNNQGYNSQSAYGNQGYNSGSQGYGNQGGYGQNWNYYGQYSQQHGWGNQQGHSKAKTIGNSANYSQQDWARYAQHYAQHSQWSQGRRQ